MANKYQLHLKGFVGGWDFDADYVDYVLGKNEAQQVNVLIDSLGGYTHTALSIFAAFKRHGNVAVHFVGMNASAATIASLGAKTITMDASAMYLVHKCSVGFFEWGSKNADDLTTLIEKIEQKKKDLDKLDANVAQMYAARCKKEPADLLQLMKEGCWLSATEAKEWGFVDEITDFEDESAPVLTEELALAMANAGIPVPEQMQKKKSMIKTITNFFKSQKDSQKTSAMKKVWKFICGILLCDFIESNEGKVTLTEDQVNSIEDTLKSNQDDLDALKDEKKSLEDEVTSLKANLESLKKKPGDTTSQVVVEEKKEEDSPMAQFVNTRNAAQELFDMFE